MFLATKFPYAIMGASAEEVTMGALVIVILGLVVFLWLFQRSVTAGHGKLLLYLVWIVGGICVVIALPPEMRPAAQVFAWVWMAGLLGLPAWWVYYAAHRRRTGAG